MTRFTVAIQRRREGTQRDILEGEGKGGLGKTWRDWMIIWSTWWGAKEEFRWPMAREEKNLMKTVRGGTD